MNNSAFIENYTKYENTILNQIYVYFIIKISNIKLINLPLLYTLNNGVKLFKEIKTGN